MRAAGAAILAVVLLSMGACGVATIGIGVDRPEGAVDLLLSFSLGLLGLGTYLAIRLVRAHGIWSFLPPLIVGAVTLGPCGAFYLAYNALPPFEISDTTGTQYALHRGVPGEVRYLSGYGVAVSAPTITPGRTDATRIWAIPVRFSNDRSSGSGHVGRCSLFVNGDYRDPHRERAEVRSLGDVDREGPAEFPAGGAYEARVAFEIPVGARDVVMMCIARAYVPAYFDLRPYTGAIK